MVWELCQQDYEELMVRYYRWIIIHTRQKMKKLMKEDLIVARRGRNVLLREIRC